MNYIDRNSIDTFGSSDANLLYDHGSSNNTILLSSGEGIGFASLFLGKRANLAKFPDEHWDHIWINAYLYVTKLRSNSHQRLRSVFIQNYPHFAVEYRDFVVSHLNIFLLLGNHLNHLFRRTLNTLGDQR